MREIVSFNTKFESLEQVNPLISKYRIDICRPDVPANKFVFSKEVIEKMSSTIKGSGVYAYYFEKEDQLGGHDGDVVRVGNVFKKTGKPVPYGFADPYKEPFWFEKDGKQWFSAEVYIWTGRNPEIADILENSIVYQSMEVSLEDEPMIDGTRKVKDALFLGFCLLQGIDPAFEGSQIEKFSEDLDDKEIELMKQEYDYFAHRYSDLNFSIPDAVKNNAKDGLELREKYGRGGTSVGANTARYLIKNSTATPEKVRHIAKYFPRHAGDNLDDKTSNGWIAWQLWGGNAGRSWSTKLVDEMNKLDEQKLSFMSDETVENETRKDGDEVNNAQFGLNSSQILEILGNALSEFKYGEREWRKYYPNAYDEEFVYVWDCEEDKAYRLKYEITENVATVDIETREQVISAGYVPVAQQEEQAAEPEQEDMSANANVDAAAMEELNEKAAEYNKKLAEKDNEIGILTEQVAELTKKLTDTETNMGACVEENKSLKAFKDQIEKQNKEFAINKTLNEVADVLTDEERKACLESAEKFSISDIITWENEVKALAYNRSKGIVNNDKFIRFALPINDKSNKNTKGLWD